MTDPQPNGNLRSKWKPVYPRDLPVIWQAREGLPFMAACLVVPMLFVLGIAIFAPGRIGDAISEMTTFSLILFLVFLLGTGFVVLRNISWAVFAVPCLAFLVAFFGAGKPWLAAYLVIGLPFLVYWMGKRRAPTPKYLKSTWMLTRERFTYSALAQVGMVGIVLLYCVTFLAPFLAPYEPNAQLDIEKYQLIPHISRSFWLGTDNFSRDVLSRIIHGAWISMTIGIFAVSLSISIGLTAGLVAGYVGGWTDWFIMRLVDLLLSLPRLVLLLVVLALLVASWPPEWPTQYRIHVIIGILAVTGWMGTARLVRGEVLTVKERDFVQAGRALGLSHARILAKHVAPNCLAPVIVSATLGVGGTILVEAGLSFLGLGVPPPTATWGAMVNQGRQFLIDAPWITFWPGITIVFAVTCFNLVGDGLRDAMDPRLSGQGRPLKKGQLPSSEVDGEAENEAA